MNFLRIPTMLHIPSRRSAAALFSSALLAIGVSSAPLAAQDAAAEAGDAVTSAESNEARQLLEATHALLDEAGAFVADVEFVAKMEQAFAAGMLPTASGRYVAAADEQGVWRVHIQGETIPFGSKETTPFDVVWNDHTVTSRESLSKTIIEGPANRVRGTLFSTVRQLQSLPGVDKGHTPFTAILAPNASTFELAPDETIGGVPCRVIHTSTKKGSGSEHLSIALGIDDHLPHRIMRHPGGFDKGNAIGAEFSNISTDDAATADQSWTIETPEDYEREVLKPAGAANPAQHNAITGTDGAKPIRSITKNPNITPSYQLSPKWQFQTRDGDVVSRKSLNGYTSVLYFWGSWCIPCRKAAPLNTELWDDYNEQKHFKMIGLAVRERDPEATYEYIQEHGYDWIQLVGADKPARLFDVSRYPTWFVIGPAGEILYQSDKPEGGDYAPIFKKIRAAVDKGLELSK